MRLLAVALVSSSLLACSDSLSSIDVLADALPLPEQSLRTRPSARRVAGIDTAELALPTRARLGETLELRVPVASGGCLGPDTTVVMVAQLTATLVPYQRVSTAPDVTCPMIYFVDHRAVRIVFAQKGEARVRIVSRSGVDQRLIAIERAITVE